MKCTDLRRFHSIFCDFSNRDENPLTDGVLVLMGL